MAGSNNKGRTFEILVLAAIAITNIVVLVLALRVGSETRSAIEKSDEWWLIETRKMWREIDKHQLMLERMENADVQWPTPYNRSFPESRAAEERGRGPASGARRSISGKQEEVLLRSEHP